MNQPALILILGGARSGKSSFAEKLAASYHQDVLFIATAEARDAEMAARIAKHQADRPVAWQTLEEPCAIAQALQQLSPPPIIILDCVNLWVTNLLLKYETEEKAFAELNALFAWFQTHQSTLILVSNEVGLGIVPVDQLSRTFRDWLGTFNQQIAAQATEVYLMVAGLPLEIKRLATKC